MQQPFNSNPAAPFPFHSSSPSPAGMQMAEPEQSPHVSTWRLLQFRHANGMRRNNYCRICLRGALMGPKLSVPNQRNRLKGQEREVKAEAQPERERETEERCELRPSLISGESWLDHSARYSIYEAHAVPPSHAHLHITLICAVENVTKMATSRTETERVAIGLRLRRRRRLEKLLLRLAYLTM